MPLSENLAKLAEKLPDKYHLYGFHFRQSALAHVRVCLNLHTQARWCRANLYLHSLWFSKTRHYNCEWTGDSHARPDISALLT
jgi:hypothetical protein